jgi:hypothetical protein
MTAAHDIDDRETLWVTDAELIRRMGVPERVARAAITMLDRDKGRSGFPQKNPLWGKRRYWPAVKAYLDRSQGLTMPVPQIRSRHADE